MDTLMEYLPALLPLILLELGLQYCIDSSDSSSTG